VDKKSTPPQLLEHLVSRGPPLIALTIIIPLTSYQRLSREHHSKNSIYWERVQNLQQRKQIASNEKWHAEAGLTEIEVQSVNQTTPLESAQTKAKIADTKRKIQSFENELRLIEVDLQGIKTTAQLQKSWGLQLLPFVLVGLILGALAYGIIRRANAQLKTQSV
jgi:hypothetical protein